MSMYEFLCKLGIKVIRFFFIIFAILFAFFNIFFTVSIDNLTSNFVNYEFGLTVIRIVFLVILTLLLYILIKKKFYGINDKTMLLVFLLIALGIAMYWFLTNDHRLLSYDDAYNVYRSATEVANHNYEVLGHHTYINTYPNNLGLLTYEFIFIKLFGEINAIYALRIINIIFMLLGYYYLYKITDILFKNKIINCTVIYLMFFSGQYIFYSFFLYGNCLSYSLAIMSVYYLIKYIKQEKKSNIVLSSIFIIGSVSIKMNSVIVLIAEILYLLLNIIESKKIFVVVILLVNIIGTYCGTTGLQKFWSAKGETDYDKTKLPLLCWVAYGMNYDERLPGHYLPEFENFHYANDYVQEYTLIEVNRFIDQVKTTFVNKPLLAGKFYCEKFLYSWANPQFEAFDQYRDSKVSEFNQNVMGGSINDFIENIWDANLTIVAIGILAFLFINKKERKLLDYIGCVIVIGGFLFHIAWEVKSVYLYQYYMYLLPCAAYGLVNLTQSKLKTSVR